MTQTYKLVNNSDLTINRFNPYQLANFGWNIGFKFANLWTSPVSINLLYYYYLL